MRKQDCQSCEKEMLIFFKINSSPSFFQGKKGSIIWDDNQMEVFKHLTASRKTYISKCKFYTWAGESKAYWNYYLLISVSKSIADQVLGSNFNQLVKGRCPSVVSYINHIPNIQSSVLHNEDHKNDSTILRPDN